MIVVDDVSAKIAYEAHKGQVDKSGVDYYAGHLCAVASMVDDPIHKAIAYLHDSIEDTHLDEESLLASLLEGGVGADDAERIVLAVSVLTKPSGDCDYWEYIEEISKNHDAKVVKIADMSHNSDLSRLSVVRDKDVKRAEKYLKAIAYLSKK